MRPASPRSEPWYARAFNRTWLRVYAHRNEAEAERNADFLVRQLRIRPGQRVLDVACGAGRYARALARRGMLVMGVDLSADLIDEARRQSPMLPGAPRYLRADSRQLPFGVQFEGALSMFTSFGYFEGPDDDLAIFRGVARALVPGGRFLLDYLNERQVRDGLVSEDEALEGSLRMRFSRRIEDTGAGPCVFKRIRVEDLESGRSFEGVEERVRLYTAAEIDDLLAQSGLRPAGEVCGTLGGAPYGPASPRLVRVAVKP